LDTAEYERKVLKDQAELEKARLPDLKVEQINKINEEARKANSMLSFSDRANELAGKIKAADATGGGLATRGFMAAARAVGHNGSEQMIRDQYETLRSEGILQRMPPNLGAMSDADRKFLEAGFPPASADGAYIAGFLQALSKGVKAAGLVKKAESAWENSFSTLPNPANRDVQIYGVSVPKGSTLDDFKAAYVSRMMPEAVKKDKGAGGASAAGESADYWGFGKK